MTEKTMDSLHEANVEVEVASGWKPRRPRRLIEADFLDMTPMIDVTFQLLIFFIFTNQLANPNPVLVPEAEYGRGISPDGKQAILIDEQGRYYAGESTREENIADSMDGLIETVRANASSVDHPLDVIISAHKMAKHKYVRELVERLGGIPNMGSITLGVEERQ